MLDTLKLAYPYGDPDRVCANLSDLRTTDTRDGQGKAYTGNLGTMRVRITDAGLLTVEGSLPRYALGDNSLSLSLSDARDVITTIAHELDTPLDSAQVRRLDAGANITTAGPPPEYMRRLGPLSRYRRDIFGSASAVHYKQRTRELAFYDKGTEVRRRHPDIVAPHHLLRYELRIRSNVARTLGAPGLRLDSLFTARTMTSLIDRWETSYSRITKVAYPVLTDITAANWSELREALVCLSLPACGGAESLIAHLKRLRDDGVMGDTQYRRCVQNIREAERCLPDMTTDTTLEELDSSIRETAEAMRDEAKAL